MNGLGETLRKEKRERESLESGGGGSGAISPYRHTYPPIHVSRPLVLVNRHHRASVETETEVGAFRVNAVVRSAVTEELKQRPEADRQSFLSAVFFFTERHPPLHGFKLHIGVRLQVSNGQILGDDRRNKHGIIFVMWIATPLQEDKGLLRKNVRRYASSWILVFLDILKIIGNS